jgi:3-oxoadipate enol-lactonase
MPKISANETELHYEIDGPEDAPVVLMSNSLGTALEMWDPQMPTLRDRFRVLRYDSRGHGRSAAPSGDYTIELLADDAIGLLDGLGVERAHFVGLSKGGMVGQVLGARNGDRLISLTLCSTASYMAPKDLWQERIRTARERGMAAMVDQVVERWFTPDFRASGGPAVERVREMILATPAEGYAACCAAIRDMDLRETIGGIEVPTMIVAGAQDPATPPERAEEIHGRVKGSTLELIDDAAHLLNIEQTVTFNHLLVEFIQRHD